ncbi:transcriptional regulator [Longimycelium tulufanense]|uniref:Transcriptional regulator n=1 Tax=Longimycelium tulufanense TaxID=907463 RepID=A0A8J3C8D8_9PSEU|nr:helix-turn-helix transcriptional regulator [Longimycelium tulufanense]GGM55326.1 transcriptional regulator [Longimycelium tulufanense]
MTVDRGTPRARVLGARLREARQRAGLSLRQMAEALGNVSHTAVGHWETGQRSPSSDRVDQFGRITGASENERKELVDLAQDVDGPHWFSVGMPTQQQQLSALIELERTATQIIEVIYTLMPGLLQTADYARALMTSGGIPKREIETRVATRIGRREVLRSGSTRLLAIIGEPAILSTMGDTNVMIDQLRFLLKAAQWETVDLRVTPTRTGWHPALEGSFMLLKYESADPVVHLENRISGQFLHQAHDVAAYEEALKVMLDVSLTPDESLGFISNQISRLESL